ncbi:MAG: ABC transporter permease [Dehalococcoidales bacterium]|nr:ABC transporter permease [Dehalococcoidales bacterium]
MSTYIIRRFIQSVIVLILVSLIVFTAMRLLPGDPILMLITREASQEFTIQQLEDLRHQYGLDKPIIVQYFDWLGGVVRGDLGYSILSKAPVTREIMRRVPITLHLGLLAFILGIVIGVPAGVICAVRRGKWVDTLVTIFANVGITIPVFWLGIILMYAFGLHFKWLPVMGYTSPFQDFWLNLKQIIMPVICLAVFPVAGIARQTRTSMLEVMQQDYIRTAWAKGLRERVIVVKHALKNGLIPVVTLSGMALSQIIGGSVLVETVFVIPGMGLLAISSVTSQDYPYVQAIIFIIAIAVLLVNFIVDISYGWLDPRIRY